MSGRHRLALVQNVTQAVVVEGWRKQSNRLEVGVKVLWLPRLRSTPSGSCGRMSIGWSWPPLLPASVRCKPDPTFVQQTPLRVSSLSFRDVLVGEVVSTDRRLTLCFGFSECRSEGEDLTSFNLNQQPSQITLSRNQLTPRAKMPGPLFEA